MNKLKVVTIVGTRPEIIRLSRLIPELDRHTQHVLVHTGQNFDPQLSETFFEELEVRPPDYYLNVDTKSLGTIMGDTIAHTEEVLLRERPDAVMILGDTNSAIAAVVAERMQIPVYHMEAGNRSFDNNVPEELNRRLVDHVASFNLPYSEPALRNLLAEGISPRLIHKTGSPLFEVLQFAKPKIQESRTLSKYSLAKGEFILLSLHRQENIDSLPKLKSTLGAVNYLSEIEGLEIIVSTHPRLRQRLAVLDESNFRGLRFVEPLGYLDYLALQLSSKFVISDSGSINEESAILGFKAINLRSVNERPESILNPNCVVCPPEASALAKIVEFLDQNEAPSYVPEDYLVPNFSQNVLSILFATVHSYRFIKGLEVIDRGE